MTQKKPDSGFTCECGQYHAFGLYVAANWNAPLTHTCSKCNAVHYVLRGKVQLIEREAGNADR